ncbi:MULTISPECIES: TetR/AcrR family transcriptional regulator [unclassified Nocardia]|uniref:TetR/AcrR family transcriptional regulator n=2 Tax=Nocardia TaxID=1817 RepID=UPI003444881A
MNAQEATEDRPGRVPPRSKRGMRTRSALVTAAREVFERDGFLDARISDISKAAGVASGSFYTYFDSKEEIFAAVVEQVREEMLHPHVRERVGIDDPRELIAAANREYLLSYRRNARLMAVLEQVSKIDEKFRVLRFERALAFVDRNAVMIRNLQDRGLVDAELDAEVTSLALSSMVSRMAYFVFVEGRKVSFEKLVKTLNQLWFNALQLKEAH